MERLIRRDCYENIAEIVLPSKDIPVSIVGSTRFYYNTIIILFCVPQNLNKDVKEEIKKLNHKQYSNNLYEIEVINKQVILLRNN